MKVLLERFHSNGYAIGFHPQAHNLELRTKQTVPCAFIRNLVACSIYEPLPVTVNHIERSVFELSRTTGDMSSIHSRRHSTKSNKQKIFELKKIKCSVWMFRTTLECFIFERVRLRSPGHRTKWNSLQKNTSGTKSSVDPALKHPRRFKLLYFSYNGTCM